MEEPCRLRQAGDPLIFEVSPGQGGECAIDLWIERHADILLERQQTLLLLGDGEELLWMLQQDMPSGRPTFRCRGLPPRGCGGVVCLQQCGRQTG